METVVFVSDVSVEERKTADIGTSVSIPTTADISSKFRGSNSRDEHSAGGILTEVSALLPPLQNRCRRGIAFEFQLVSGRILKNVMFDSDPTKFARDCLQTRVYIDSSG